MVVRPANYLENRMNRLAALIALAALSPLAATAEELTVEGADLQRAIACDGEDVGIYGADNQIDLTGNCGNVLVYGSKHVVTFEHAASLTVSGMNHITTGGDVAKLIVDTADSTVTVTIDGKDAAGAIDVSGTGHKVKLNLVSASTLEVAGSDQSVEWTIAKGIKQPKVQMSGVGNKVGPAP